MCMRVLGKDTLPCEPEKNEHAFRLLHNFLKEVHKGCETTWLQAGTALNMRQTKDVGRWTDGRQRKVVENQRQGDRQAAAAVVFRVNCSGKNQ